MSTVTIHTPFEREHSQLSFAFLIVKIGWQTKKLQGIQVAHENGKNLHVPAHV